MKKHRPTLIYVGLAVLVSTAWTVLAVAFPLPGWWSAVGVVATFAVADQGEQAITRRLNRPKHGRRHTHATPRTAKTERTSA